MDDPSLTSATRPNTLPSIQIHVPGANADRRSVSRSSPFTTDLPSRGMPIPGAGLDPPPPLPPPRFLPGGADIGYELANRHASFGQKSYGSVPPSSSLFGGYGIPPPKIERIADIGLRDVRPRHIDEGYSSLSSVALTPPMCVSHYYA
jgi:hypothetical protein